MIDRTHLRQIVQKKLDANRVVALIGPRQCGKTTLAREFVSPSSVNYFDLENPLSLASLDQPMTALQDLTGLVVIDEIQRRPEIFQVLRVLADRTPLPTRF
ncbi:MAG: AAA family ATPase [Anaerolineaceae bacterium]|nr:AAA family ATPase [Anaerolineaceae bacterium]